MQKIDVAPAELEKVLAILNAFVPDCEVWVFGSRVTKTAKKFSDLDLAIIGAEPIPDTIMADLREAFTESDLPFKVDVVDWASAKKSFRDIIKTNYSVLKGQNRGL